MPTATMIHPWPALPWPAWRDTATTLHRWCQVVGKVKLEQTTLVNHWWNVSFRQTARGLTTAAIPHGDRTFEITFDFVAHRVRILASNGDAATITLGPRSVASFYRELMEELAALDLEVRIRPLPVEVPDHIPLDRDEEHRSYEPEEVDRFFAALTTADRLMHEFRSRFVGKCSPVQFFWGGFDHAVTRFSGRRAPEHPSVPNVPDHVVREAYSHEVSSCGFWPGGDNFPEPVFYSYAYPEPPGFRDAAIHPREAHWAGALGEFVLPYEAVRLAPDPDRLVLDFFQSTYEAAADLGRWDRAALERG